MNDNSVNLFGDQARCWACENILAKTDEQWKSSLSENRPWHGVLSEELQEIGSETPENQKRLKGLLSVKQALNEIAGNGKNFADHLNTAADHFNEAWGNGQPPNGGQSWRNTEQIIGNIDDREQSVVNWLRTIEGFTRGHAVVLDLLLNNIFSGDVASFTSNPTRSWLYDTFRQRVDSIVRYRHWAKGPKSIDYCKDLSRSVCTPILLGAGKQGVVMWLTVDLFEDGLGSLAPDLFSLGWSQINPENQSQSGATRANESPDHQPTEAEEKVSLLDSFDSMWELSRLGDLGFSGRWRITNRPTTQCAALHLEEARVPYSYLSDYTGRSAECAMLVSLLATSGFVYEPPPEKKPSGLKPRVFLNTFFAATAKVNQSDNNELDVRKCSLGRVYDVDCKLGASTRYKYEPGKEESPPLIDTIVISAGDYEARKGDTKSPVYKAIEREKQEKQATKGNQPAVRGVHFQACSTVQKALDWMLATNNWSRLRKEAQKKTWESQWGIVRNESGQPISWDVDENGVHKTVSEEDGICTGSLEYMRNPFGGARRVTPENEPQSESVDNDEVLNVE